MAGDPPVRRELAKKHPMRELASRPLRPGRHRLTVQVNGVRTAALEFDLTA